MKKTYISVLSFAFLLIIVFLLRPATGGKLSHSGPLPEFSDIASDWINSEPLKIENLQGKVILLDFWTFDCWNCYRSFPWLNALEKRFASEDFLIVGIHTPEFDHEKKRENVIAKVNEFKLHHPVMMDNDFSYWSALKNRYWPSFYLVDKNGNVRANFIGETHEGDRNALQIEQMITDLLNE